MRIVWKKHSNDGWFAYSGRLIIGFVGQREDGTCFYKLDAVSTKWVTKGTGEVKSVAGAKRALTRAWRTWLTDAGLIGQE
ncbi:hypothetical protein [Brucella pseudogrignonensis]|uniref:Uncharacterized protein n=1 Tax=Brucella pseudogrignonensis TaxID=419475 RepID=A0ABU1M7J3_9HYPH|nr:hypothetical protein [Brucella pseudogrignonensis]MDR6432015.1 hypothetical protein [Brucella pseudogrignonensis]